MFSSSRNNLEKGHFISKFFNSRYAGIFCLLIAVINKCIIAYVYADLEADESLYLLFAKSFLDTGLFSEPIHLIENGLDTYVYNRAIVSPFYSIAAAPILRLTSSYPATQFIMAVIGWILFFGGLYKVAKIIFSKPWQTALFILFAGFFLYPHELSAGPKDTLAVAFTLWSVFFSYRFIEGTLSIKHTVLLALSLSCMALTKLMCGPLVLLFLILVFAFSKRSKNFLKQYSILISIVALMGALFYFAILKPLYQLQNVLLPLVAYDGTTFIRGFFPQNLKSIFPFISSSFLNTNFWGVQLEKAAPFSFAQVMHLFQLIDLLIVAILLGLFIYKRFTISKQLWLPIYIAAALVGQVLYLSLTYSAFSYKSSTNLWTYVSDARTFLFPMLLIQLLLFLFLFNIQKAKAITFLFLSLLIFESLHGLYFTLKSAGKSSEIMNAKNDASPNKKITNIIKNSEQKGKTALVTPDNVLRRYAIVNNISSYAFGTFENYLPQTSTDSIFIIAIHLQDSMLLKKFKDQQLLSIDTIQPFVLHTFKIRNAYK